MRISIRIRIRVMIRIRIRIYGYKNAQCIQPVRALLLRNSLKFGLAVAFKLRECTNKSLNNPSDKLHSPENS